MRETGPVLAPLAVVLGLMAHRAAQPPSPPKVDIISVTGCLTPGPGDTWLLTSATDPSPVSTGRAPASSAAAASAAAAGTGMRAVGKNRFRLIGTQAFDVASRTSHLVRIKGLLIAADEKRINLTSLQDVAATCAAVPDRHERSSRALGPRARASR